MSNNKISSNVKIYQFISFSVHALVIVAASILLLIEPVGFDVKEMILPLVILLFLSSLGIGHKIATKGGSDGALSVLGTILIAIACTFIGFFVVAAVAWFIGVSHAS